MMKYKKPAIIGAVVAAGLLIQVTLSVIGSASAKDTPGQAALEFARAYYQRDASLADRLCEEHSNADGSDAVDAYIHSVGERARERGFGRSFMQNRLTRMKTRTEYLSDTEARVRITGERRTAINPVYGTIASVFNLSEAHSIDETLRVIKADDGWRACAGLSTVFGNS